MSVADGPRDFPRRALESEAQYHARWLRACIAATPHRIIRRDMGRLLRRHVAEVRVSGRIARRSPRRRTRQPRAARARGSPEPDAPLPSRRAASAPARAS